jgi:hypothetical protein
MSRGASTAGVVIDEAIAGVLHEAGAVMQHRAR